MIVARAGRHDETPSLVCEDLSAVIIACGVTEVRTGSGFGTGGEKLVEVWRC